MRTSDEYQDEELSGINWAVYETGTPHDRPLAA